VAAIVAAAGLVGGAVAYGSSAGATPQPTITQVQARVNLLQSQFDQVSQQYDQVTQQVAAAKARLASVLKQDGQAEAQYTAARAKLRQVAVASYETANQSSIASLLTTGDPAQALQQASMLEALGSNDSAEVTQFLAAAQQVQYAQANVSRTEKGIAGLQAQLAAKRSHLDSLLAKNKALLATLTAVELSQVTSATINVSAGSFTTHATDPWPVNTPAQKAMSFVFQQLGCWYTYGGTGPCSAGFDCSGLIQAAYNYAGISIARDTYSQIATLPSIPESELKPGDIVFFEGGGHEGMFVGTINGVKMEIDAPRTGEQIRMLPLNTDWYAANYYESARVPGSGN
jgi:cell wall-associated NlpC family hydrolase